MKNTIKKKKKPFNRFFVLVVIMGVIFFAIISRLIYLQVYKYVDFSDRANTRARRFLAEKAPRGKIYDSQGNLLATNVQTYAINFVETDEANKSFFSTMAKVFKLLDENNEKQIDEFKLQINDDGEPYFDFGNITNADTLKALEVRFKRDRGLNEEIKNKLFPKKEGDLSDDEEAKINQELIKITPKQTFEYLVKHYKLYGLLNPTEEEEKKFKKVKAEDITDELTKKYSMKFLRRYMVIKDTMKMQSFSGFKPVVLATNISKNTAFIFLQKLNDIPGINVNLEPMRYYPYHELASGALGYISSINPDKTDKYKEKGYDVSTDQIGVSGIEGTFENLLKGTKGGDTVKVNSAGRKIEELFKLEPSPGQNVHLTIDKNIQYSAEQMMKHQLEYLQNSFIDWDTGQRITRNATRGAAVAIEVKTGRVLALVSYPTFDPNVFSTPGALTPDMMKKYFNTNLEEFGENYISRMGLNKTVDDLFPKDSNGNREDKYDITPKPTYNYATMGLTAPGSTFKPMTSLVALEEGLITSSESIPERYNFNEHPDVFGRAFSPQDNKFHEGIIDVRQAIAVSCNHFFYECGYRMYMKNGQNPNALDTLANYGWKLGLGVKPSSKEKPTTGIEIPENFGQIYNFETFKKQMAYYSKFEMVNQLESGNMGSYIFVPLDISYIEEDDDNLKKAKKELKDLISDRLNKVGTDEFESDKYNFNKKLKETIETIEKYSKKYKESISKYESNGKKYSINATVAAIEQFILNKKSEITSPAQLVYASIGQGINNFTPVQLASYIATIVNGGTRYKVHMVDKITNFQGKIVEEFKPEILSEMDIKSEYVQAIKEGMQRTNSGDGGTGSGVFKNFPISTGGKTGTATFQKGQELFGRAAFGVYVSFAPVEDPEVAVAVVNYDGGHGNLGAPVARAIFETYFRSKLKKEFPDYMPHYFLLDGTYDYSLNPPLEDIKDDGVHKSEADDKIQKQKDEEKQKQLEKQKQEKEVEQQKEEVHRVKKQQRRHFKKRR